MKLIRRLFSSGNSKASTAPLPACNPLEPVNIIGDIHGCSDLLEALLIKLDTTEVIVTVGDYVDRGEASHKVLERLFELQTAAPKNFICLMGNHEKMLLQFLDEPTGKGRRWIKFGGLQTLASFGIPHIKEIMSDNELVAARDHLHEYISPDIETWLRSLPLIWSSGNLHVVHAAADPNCSMLNQDEKVLLWGHGDFFDQPRIDGNWIAHGHTVVNPAQQDRSRISVDTGAYYTGVLTAARCLPTGDVQFITSSY